MSTFTYNDHTYTLVTTPKTWLQAKSYAESLGGYLAIVSSQEENDRILSEALKTLSMTPSAQDGGGARYVWLGASDLLTEGSWKWVSGTALTGGFTNWGTGTWGTEPDNFDGQDALALGLEPWPAPSGGIGVAGKWNDVDENNALYFVVETEPVLRNERTAAATGQGYDGVVRISSGGNSGSGVLLYGGQAILTVAHLFGSSNPIAAVYFETTSGTVSETVRKVSLYPGHDATNANGDLALVWLSSSAPVAAQRHELYRASDEIGQRFTLAGYGTLESSPTTHLRTQASNQFEAEAGQLKVSLGTGMAWTPSCDTILVADYDNGSAAQDALGRLLNVTGLGLGGAEGLNMPGDSGGPAFIGDKVAGIASYTADLELGSIHPDIDSTSNSSFGEMGFWQRVSSYQQWIDQSVRAEYPNAPTKPEEVKKSVPEGQSGTTYAYFLFSFTGTRTDTNQVLSADYITRDGTAKAGQDYLAVSGTLKLYPGESQAVIPVEILGDTVPETDETFYLDVTNPVGGSFGQDVVTLTAVRTIINDDGVLA